MRLTYLPNHKLACYLDQAGVAGVFSRYVIARQPDAEWLAVVEHGRVVGTAVAGSSVGLYEAYPHWIFAGTPEAALLLAEATRSESPALNFPLSYLDQIQAIYPQHQISVDRLYVLPQSRFRAIHGAASVQRLDAAALQTLDLPAELQPFIGALDDWQADYALYGIVLHDTLVCIGETLVQDRHHDAIQQIYTLPAYRGCGLAQQLVSVCCETLLNQHKLPIYVAAEDNLPSRHLAEKLGFFLDSCWGYLS